MHHVPRKFFFSLDTIEEMLFPTSNNDAVKIDPHQQFLQQDLVVEEDAETARQSLVLFLNQWAVQLAHDKNSQNTGLATPITVQEFKPPLLYDNNNNPNNTMLQMKIMFRPPPRYLSYNEQKSMEKGVLPDRKGGKLDSKSPGGIALSVTTTTTTTMSQPLLRLVVQRCGVNRDTVIKASSERAIVRRLKEALRIWQKVQAMK